VRGTDRAKSGVIREIGHVWHGGFQPAHRNALSWGVTYNE
jgi:hypothetical protein